MRNQLPEDSRIRQALACDRISDLLRTTIETASTLDERTDALFQAAYVLASNLALDGLPNDYRAALRYGVRTYLRPGLENEVFPCLEVIEDVPHAGFSFDKDSSYVLAIPRTAVYLYDAPTNGLAQRGIILPRKHAHLSNRVVTPFP